jgi:hypothetical protein
MCMNLMSKRLRDLRQSCPIGWCPGPCPLQVFPFPDRHTASGSLTCQSRSALSPSQLEHFPSGPRLRCRPAGRVLGLSLYIPAERSNKKHFVKNEQFPAGNGKAQPSRDTSHGLLLHRGASESGFRLEYIG